LLKELDTKLSKSSKKEVFFELIFMTYSYVHNAINHEAFPNAIELYNKDIMTGRGRGKYAYKTNIKEEAKKYMEDLMRKYFPNNEIKYIV
jgi:spore photoproduct lyase